MITNSALNPNAFLKAFFTDTFLCNGTVLFDQTLSGVPHLINGLYGKNDTAFATPKTVSLPNTTKRINLRVFAPPTSVYTSNFIAHYNLTGTNYGTPSLTPRCFLLDGSEIEIYGIAEMRKIVVLQNNFDPQPFYLSISLYK